MATRNQIPPSLEPFLRLPPETSLILLTGTLACSPNWLTARFVSSTLNEKSTGEDVRELVVILVSWMRDLTFWQNELRRTTGLDVTKSPHSGRFGFVDAFRTGLFTGQGIILVEVEKAITNAIEKLSKQGQRRIVLLLDSPDVLLATGSVTSQQLNRSILNLRSRVYSTVLICSADLPLISASTSLEQMHLPIEMETAAFLVQQAHLSRFVISVRELDTGAARDVSGVLRITRGGDSYDLDGGDMNVAQQVEELYLVQRDGKVKVFGRGAESG